MHDSDNFISSSQNPTIKGFKKLQRKKYRDEHGLFVIENPLTIRDGIKHSAQIKELYFTLTFKEKNPDLFDDISKAALSEKRYEVADNVFAASVSLDHPQGIAAVYEKQEESVDITGSIVYLNGISDPGNAGAIMRSCAAFGISTVIADTETADFYNPKTLSAAKESIFLLSLARRQYQFLVEIKKTTHVCGLDSGTGSDIKAAEFKLPVCLVFGSEAHGISEECKQYVDTFVTIPMARNGVESLNVAGSAAIALHRLFSVTQ